MAQRSDTAGSAVPGATGIGRLGSRPAGAGFGSPLSRRRLREQLIGWGFALPFVLVFTIFLAGPIVASLVLSFTDFGLRDLRNPLGTDFVGLANYQALLDDPKFRKAMINTAYFVIVGVPLTLVLGLALALALDRGIRRFRTLFRVGYYLPVVTSIVAIAVVWRFLLNPDQGLINLLLAQVGIDGPSWLADPMLAMPSIIAMAAWRNLGFAMIVFLAGLQTIPAQLYEAAAIDGAGRWQAFRSVTLPAAAADDPLPGRDHDDRLPAAVRGAVRHDRRRPARPDPVDLDVHVPAGLRVLQPGLRRRHRVDPVHPRRDRGRGPDPPAAVGGVAR